MSKIRDVNPNRPKIVKEFCFISQGIKVLFPTKLNNKISCKRGYFRTHISLSLTQFFAQISSI